MSKILTAYQSIEEAPETDRNFIIEEDGKFYYQNDGLINTIENQRKAEKAAKAELEALKAEKQRLAEQRAEAEKETQKPEQKKSAGELELEKRIAILEAEKKREREENRKLKIEQVKRNAAEKAGIRAEVLEDGMYHNKFDLDESNNIFVKDSDGTPKINITTGQRMTPEEFFTEEAKKKTWIAKNSASGTGASGTGLRGAVNQVAASASDIRTMKEEYRKAQISGNIKLVQKLMITAAEKGIELC